MYEQLIASLTEELADTAHVGREEIHVVRSPYRVCPLGAHVDHQLGEVTSMALDRALFLAFVPTEDDTVHVESHNFPGAIEFSLGNVSAETRGDWGDYLRGAVYALRRHYSIEHGLRGIVQGHENVGGLSSSAAVGVAYLLALERANGIDATTEENIELDRIIENDYIGLNNGLLDQSTILLSRQGRLMYLDCRNGDTALYPCGTDASLRIAVLYSGLRQQLSDTDYNRRVEECQQAARLLLETAGLPAGDQPKLREVDREVYENHRDALPSKPRRRADHFFSEQRRVREGVQLWQAGELEAFGRLITESGRSSVENYECGNRYLRTAYRVLVETPGMLGARFSGAGFRGCSIGLMAEEPPEGLAEDILERYVEEHPDMEGEAEVTFCRPAHGAGFVPTGRSESSDNPS
jgi:galactokinase/galacturonokinase